MMQPKILLVDDREDNLISIESILGQDGYQFVKANSGIQALKILLNQFDFALILTPSTVTLLGSKTLPLKVGLSLNPHESHVVPI